ncbi:putative mediator of RNA polymerase II transcription subunit 26c [Apostasia shenzhenica]|uniref:Putative mediator of RNA polymerase II transcription subunit 26c n=1 Tax=Apostasia shenzhenica TaxID=1088818 RepID=A0A2H9ZX29_9ASPA|nr:putative mediator of RNA polymerase II transcription subunit 26c [Apostasia shenzhenica]
MHGREAEERKPKRHMLPVPAPAIASVAEKRAVTLPTAAPAVDSVQASPSPYSFFKDGRKIQVGGCALFQAGNASPFIGIIHGFSANKPDSLILCVNWLYRPADINLANGILLEAAPNELFYSFHKDIISAASLLHPCKVAFLGKGVELPLGISSFICRRVYDIANKCLWWLSDQDYINGHQEEVDQLLDKTHLEMHAAVQSGGRSPKQLNVPASMQQLKSGSDGVQSNSSPFSSPIKGKKRDRGDQGSEPIKRERTVKPDDDDFTGSKFDDNMMKSEISKITEHGALVSTDGVEKLVQLMQVDNNKKIDLPCRVLLADVIAATEKFDCLNRFVQIRGVPVLDEWLQEAHKGKTGDGNSPKDGDKAVEELLLALLHALDKLPVNLNALQTCHIGKSVNNLRGHKNLEIQRKARSLVDTWKKRVDAEIKTNDAKTLGSSQAVTWPVKQGLSEVSYPGNKRTLSGELSKFPITQQTTYKGLTGKSVHTDSIVKSTTVVVGSVKVQSSSAAPAAVISKESNSKVTGGTGTLDPPQIVAKEEKSSSSSQSQNNSQSNSSDHGKPVGSSSKEDARCSTAGSVNATRTSGCTSRQRRSSNGFLSNNVSGVPRETKSSKSGLLVRTSTIDMPQAGMNCERMVDMPALDHGSSHRLIVRLPNPGRSPGRSTGGCYLDGPSAASRPSSPCVPNKHDHVDRKVIGKNNACLTRSTDVNTESWQSNVKERLVGSNDNEAVRGTDITRTDCSSSANETGPSAAEAKMRNSFSSMNALIESCAKYSEPTTPLSGVDDIGMNLLASVAAGEMSKSDLATPAASSEGSPAREDHLSGTNESKSRDFTGDAECQNLSASDKMEFVSQKHGADTTVSTKDELQDEGANCPRYARAVTSLREDKPEQNGIPHDLKEEYDREDARENQDDGSCGKVDHFINCKSEVKNAMDQNKTGNFLSGKIGGPSDASDICKNSLSGTVDCEGLSSGRNIEKIAVEESSSRHLSDKEEQGAAIWKGQSELKVTERKADGAPTSSVTDNVPCLTSQRKVFSSLPTSTGDPTGPSAGPLGTINISEIIDKVTSVEKCGEDSTDIGDSKGDLDAGAKLDFDLNEGISGNDVNQTELSSTASPVCSPAFRKPTLSPFSSSATLKCSQAPITVAAPAKGAFLPPENLLKSNQELGWKGSAATSAFRPAEPRKLLEMQLNTHDMPSCDTAIASKHGRSPLEFDLNVPDERSLEDIASQCSAQTRSLSGVMSNHDLPPQANGLDLDLNRVDDGTDNRHFQASTSRRLEVPFLSTRPGFVSSRDFDLNNGPCIDEGGAEPIPRSQNTKSTCSISFVPPITGLHMNTAELGSGWFPRGNSYPATEIPSFLPDRGEQTYPIAVGAHRMLGSVTGADIYRGPVLSSSPAMTYSPAATAFSYGSFPFGSSFPLTSTSFSTGSTSYVDSSAIHSQLVSYPYMRPYVVSLPDSSTSSGLESSRRWGWQGLLDLNAGPLHAEEVKGDRLPSSSRQMHVAGSQSFIEEQARLYHLSGAFKRKEPDAGWDSEKLSFKPPSWQ